MKKTIGTLKVLMGFTGSIVLCSSVMALSNFPAEIFDATYKYINPGLGDSSMRMISDGKGHMRHEMTANGSKNVAILDYPAQTMITIMDAQHLAMKMPMKTNSTKITDEASAKRANAKSLGAKVMDGHPCHGYETKDGDTVSQVWIGDDIHYMVHSEVNTPSGKIVMALKSWSNAAPTASLFQIPTGCKVMDMPQLGMAESKMQR